MSQSGVAGPVESGSPIELETDNGVLRLTLSNPPANALSVAVMQAIQRALDDAKRDPAVRVIVIAAAGSIFSAGHDLKEMTGHRGDSDAGRAFYAEAMAICAKMMISIVRHPKPMIAQVDGLATAAGCQLVASCDLAVASDRAAFATPGVNIGLFCSTPMVALSRNVSRKNALEMLLTGNRIDANTAREFGLINRVVRDNELTAEVTRIAREIGSKSPLTLKSGKEAFYRQLEMGLTDAYDYTARVMVENMLSRDAEEGINAFIEKRKPRWAEMQPAPGHDYYSNRYITQILNDVKTVAIVGASANTIRPSFFVTKYLIDKGYRVIPVNPGQAGREILGQTVYARLADITEPIDMVEIFRGSDAVPGIADEILQLEPLPGVVWMQLTVRHDEAAEKLEAAGIKVVMDRCPKIEYARLAGEIGWNGVNSRVLSAKKPLMRDSVQNYRIRAR